MGYAIMRIEKIKDFSEMSSRYKHNFRIYNVENSDLQRQKYNQELVELNGRTYEDVYKETVTGLHIRGANMRKERSNGIKAFEIMLRFSKEDMGKFSMEEWEKKNIEWLEKTFNPEGNAATYTDKETGEEKTIKTSNVLSAVVHNDEDCPHIHAFVVPVDDKGNINASFYNGGRAKMTQLQNDYAKHMEVFGLERGEPGSIATAEEHAKFQSEISKAVSATLPDPMPGESVEKYRLRAEQDFQREKVHHREDVVKLKQEVVKAKSVSLEERKAFDKKKNTLGRQLKMIATSLGKDVLDEEDIRSIKRVIREDTQFKKAVEMFPDKDYAAGVLKNYQDMILWQQQRELEMEQQKKKKEKERK